MKDIFT